MKSVGDKTHEAFKYIPLQLPASHRHTLLHLSHSNNLLLQFYNVVWLKKIIISVDKPLPMSLQPSSHIKHFYSISSIHT